MTHLKDPKLVNKLALLWQELEAKVDQDEDNVCSWFFKGLYRSRRIQESQS